MKPPITTILASLNWKLALAVLSFVVMLMLPGSMAAAEISQEVQACLDCHSDSSMELTLEDGSKLSLYIDPAKFSASIHGDKLNCNDCHTDITDVPHPEKKWKDRRAFTLSLYETCKKCHFANYTKTLESVHYKLVAKGDTRAPVCIDCHGSHYIHRPNVTKIMISQTCRTCHESIYQTYSKSVHGNALLVGKNSDAPVCTDCHRAHDIEDPRTPHFLAQSPELCGKCHGNEALMKKYGLSSAVLKTYLQDFHGVSISFYKNEKTAKLGSWKAVCTDCHGVHDITKVTAQNSPVLKKNLLNNCKKCHANASENFPDAWLSHYEPSTDKAPLVYYAGLFYKLFIPFTIGGLVIHILLHIWRIATNR